MSDLMSNITIAIPDYWLLERQGLAARLHVKPEELMQASLEEILARPDAALQRGASYVLNKNAELYRRLA
jgi:hypothetical protein